MKKPISVQSLNDFGRTRLSKTFFMRDFMFSEIAAMHGQLSNIPDDPDLAIAAGTELCERLLEPIQDAFGRIAIRSSFRSAEVNAFGAEMQRTSNKSGYTCSANEKNYARHIWDRRDADGMMGATACIVVPSFFDRYQADGDWQKMAWWIHDTLPYSSMEFFPKANFWAFNISWRETPVRSIKSRAAPLGILTRPGMENHMGSHETLWRGILDD